MTLENVQDIIDALKSAFKYIIIDVTNVFDLKTVKILDNSDEVLFPIVANIPNLQNVSRCLEFFNKIGYADDKIKLILNRVTKDDEIKSETIENTLNLDDINRAQIIGSRMAFKNYTAFTNPGKEPVSSIFAATPLEGNLSGLTFSGCGDLNPLQNDIPHNVIKTGKKVLLNDGEAFILGDGTRSNPQKPNLMLSGDLTQMDPYYFGGFKTGEGGEIYNTVAIPIPVLTEEIYNNLLIQDKDVIIPVADIKGRHLPLTETNYNELWEGYDLRPQFDRTKCSGCDVCEAEQVCPTNAFSQKRLDLSRCFGCGMCVNFCSHNSFNMNTGNVDLNIDDKEVNIPIICRQSDRLRANKLSLKLKKMIKSGEFKL